MDAAIDFIVGWYLFALNRLASFAATHAKSIDSTVGGIAYRD